MKRSPFPLRPTNARPAFSLLELLAAVVLMGILMVIVVPAVQSLKEANDFAILGDGVAGIQQ